MKVTFIRPQMVASRSAAAMEPLVFALLAGLTPPDVELELFDEWIEPVPQPARRPRTGLLGRRLGTAEALEPALEHTPLSDAEVDVSLPKLFL